MELPEDLQEVVDAAGDDRRWEQLVARDWGALIQRIDAVNGRALDEAAALIGGRGAHVRQQLAANRALREVLEQRRAQVVRAFGRHPERVDAELVRKLVDAYRGGAGVLKAGRQVGLSETAARRVLVAAGVVIRPPGGADRSDEVGRQVVATYVAGHGIRAVAVKVGVTQVVVRAVLRDAGIDTSARNRPLRQRILVAHRADVPVEEIAARLRTNVAHVRAVIAAAAVEAELRAEWGRRQKR